MTLRDLMESWLESGDETQRQHAAIRLAILDGAEPPPVRQSTVEYRRGKRVVRLGMKIETRPP